MELDLRISAHVDPLLDIDDLCHSVFIGGRFDTGRVPTISVRAVTLGLQSCSYEI